MCVATRKPAGVNAASYSKPVGVNAASYIHESN
jgi:hypothetical protein